MDSDQWLLWAARLDAYRVIPRLLLVFYGTLCGVVAMWFMGLPDPSGPQVTFVSTVLGGAAVWFGFYVNSGGKK